MVHTNTHACAIPMKITMKIQDTTQILSKTRNQLVGSLLTVSKQLPNKLTLNVSHLMAYT